MPLNCPQRGDDLRLPCSGGGRRPSPARKRRPWLIVAFIVLLAVLAVAGYWGQQAAGPADETPPAPAADEPPAATLPHAPPTDTVEATPPDFCERDFAAIDKRRNDIDTLQAAGGLVHLLEREQATPPFTCAAFYLSHGLDVNAVDTNGVTALHYAIHANAPKMLQFVIDHGADLQQKAGAKQLKPMAYAYYLALNDRSTDRNPIIDILNTALEDSEDEDRTP